MLKILEESRFRKDLEKAKKRGRDVQKLLDVVSLLVHQKQLPVKNRDHQLKGNLNDYRECHLEPDWLLIYKKTPSVLILSRTGTHSDLF